MASGKEYLHFILEQLSNLDDISYRPMMGEFILYYRGKIVGGIYDDRLLVKKTRSALELMPAAICELPYEGAKEMLLVDEVDSKVFLTELFEAMVNGYGYHLPDRIIKPAKTVQTPTAGVLFLWVCRDSREAAQGGAGLRWRPQSVSRFEAPTEPAGETSPLLRQSRHIGARGKSPVRR